MAAAAGGSCEHELFVAASSCRPWRARSPHRTRDLAKKQPAWLELLHVALVDIKSTVKSVCIRCRTERQKAASTQTAVSDRRRPQSGSTLSIMSFLSPLGSCKILHVVVYLCWLRYCSGHCCVSPVSFGPACFSLITSVIS